MKFGWLKLSIKHNKIKNKHITSAPPSINFIGLSKSIKNIGVPRYIEHVAVFCRLTLLLDFQEQELQRTTLILLVSSLLVYHYVGPS